MQKVSIVGGREVVYPLQLTISLVAILVEQHCLDPVVESLELEHIADLALTLRQQVLLLALIKFLGITKPVHSEGEVFIIPTAYKPF